MSHVPSDNNIWTSTPEVHRKAHKGSVKLCDCSGKNNKRQQTVQHLERAETKMYAYAEKGQTAGGKLPLRYLNIFYFLF